MEKRYGISIESLGFDGRRRGPYTKVRELQPGDQVDVFFQAGGNHRRVRTSIVDIRPTAQINNPQVLIGDSRGLMSVGGGTIARRILTPQSQNPQG